MTFRTWEQGPDGVQALECTGQQTANFCVAVEGSRHMLGMGPAPGGQHMLEDNFPYGKVSTDVCVCAAGTR